MYRYVITIEVDYVNNCSKIKHPNYDVLSRLLSYSILNCEKILNFSLFTFVIYCC